MPSYRRPASVPALPPGAVSADANNHTSSLHTGMQGLSLLDHGTGSIYKSTINGSYTSDRTRSGNHGSATHQNRTGNNSATTMATTTTTLSHREGGGSISTDHSPSVWERRRRRLQRVKSNNSDASESSSIPEVDEDKNFGEFKTKHGRHRRSKNNINKVTAAGKTTKKKLLPPSEEDYDPYDSDPGESYRDHCMKFRGIAHRKCISMPAFMMRNSRFAGNNRGMIEDETVMTAPPSPLQSEMGDPFSMMMRSSPSLNAGGGHRQHEQQQQQPQPSMFGGGPIPASLPPHLSRVSYSLRSSITDGADKQPSGPSVMERRELRPNNLHINVSHWSDEGGRPYMEDR
jgi:hypothetical protein